MSSVVQQAIEGSVLQALHGVEAQVDDELAALENPNDDDLYALRMSRIREMKAAQRRREEWAQRGHGVLTDLANEKDFFAEIRGEERVVCHFYRSNWPCKVMDTHLAKLARLHMETRFIKVDAEKSPFLTEKLKIWMLPTLALIKKSKVADYVVGLDPLGGSENFSTTDLQDLLFYKGCLDDNPPIED